jgi:hypothetical protein
MAWMKCTNCKRSDIDQHEAGSGYQEVKRKEAKEE